jgi:hypothetical protein
MKGIKNKPLRLASVLQTHLALPAEVMPPADSEIDAVCFECGLAQSLYQASISKEDGETLYRCHECGDLIAVLSPETSKKWPAQTGNKLGPYVLRHRSAVLIHYGRQEGNAGLTLNLEGQPDAFGRKTD